MKIDMFIRRSLYFLVFCVTCTLVAREESVNVRINAVSLTGAITELNFANGSKVETLSIYEGLRSQKYRYTGTPVITFFREDETTLDEAGKPVPSVVGSVQLPSNTGDFLLLFSKVSGSVEKYQIAAIKDDLLTFKPGMYRFINIAPFDIAIKLGDTKRLIKKFDFVDIEADATEGSYQDAMMFSLVEGEKPRRSYKGGFYYSSKKRFIYVIRAKEKGRKGGIEYSVIPEQVAANQTEP